MPVFAITGTVCSGKTTVLNILKGRGASIYNVDEVIHSYYRNKGSTVYKKIKKVFPQALTNKENNSNSKLREAVFSDSRSLERLERIVHPEIIKDLKGWVKRSKKKKGVCIAEVPLLFEKRLNSLFDRIIFVYTYRRIVLKRLREKNKLSTNDALEFIALGKNFGKKMKNSDFVIKNNQSKKKLERKVHALWRELTKD